MQPPPPQHESMHRIRHLWMRVVMCIVTQEVTYVQEAAERRCGCILVGGRSGRA